MKVLLTSILLLASVSSTALAAVKTETLFILPSPQPCRVPNQPECTQQSNEIYKKQIDWINANYKTITPGSKLLGVAINGDLTYDGTEDQLNAFEQSLSTADISYFVGLGDNDFRTNKIGTINWFNKFLVSKIWQKHKDKTNIHFNEVSGANGVNGAGSLGYAIDLGPLYLIQLGDATGPTHEVLEDGKYRIDKLTSANWLRSALNYADLNKKQVVLLTHNAEVSQEVYDVLDDFETTLRFASEYKSDPVGDVDFFYMGFSSENEMYRLDLSYDDTYQEKDASRWSGYKLTKLKYEATLKDFVPVEPSVSEANNELEPEADQENNANDTVIRIRNHNGYAMENSQIRYLYNGEDKKLPESQGCVPVTGNATYNYECNSGSRSFNNLYTVIVPAGAINVSANALNKTGMVWDPNREVMKNQNNLETKKASFINYFVGGTTLKPDCRAEVTYINKLVLDENCLPDN